jgi:hypothetical protein
MGFCQRGVELDVPAKLAQPQGLGFGAGAHKPLALSVLHVGFARFNMQADGRSNIYLSTTILPTRYLR